MKHLKIKIKFTDEFFLLFILYNFIYFSSQIRVLEILYLILS